MWNDEYLTVIDEPLMGQDRAKMANGHMTGINNLLTEDMIVAETMGPIADRSGEYLGVDVTARRILAYLSKRSASEGFIDDIAAAIESWQEYKRRK